MRICHWSLSNGSGLNRVATNICNAERQLGLESFIAYTDSPIGAASAAPSSFVLQNHNQAYDCDIHCGHAFIPLNAKGKKIMFMHGTPEHCVTIAIEQGKQSPFSGGDPLMIMMHMLNTADLTVTFWERHAYILKSLNPKAEVVILPMGVDKAFWAEGISRGKWAGSPSLFTSENAHQIKWPLDLILAWPRIAEGNINATLHLHYLPHDLHRYFYPIMYANGTAFRSFSSATFFSPGELRNAFKSVDYYVSPVRYGDHNTICFEAKAAGCKVISYRGNVFADYWMSEGDQRTMADEILKIISGEVSPRETVEVPDIKETAETMKGIYEQL